MKKIYLFLSAAVITSASFAQYRVGNGPTAGIKNVNLDVQKMENNKAAGDSLFYFNGRQFFLMDPTDNTDFALANQDFDGGQPNQSASWPTEFIFSFFDNDAAETPYTTTGGNFFPQDLTSGVDSAWYIGASSWFTPAAAANNWWNFGPITIPANTTGNTLYWFDKFNPAWTDAYDVFVVNMTNVTDPTVPDGPTDILANTLTPDFTHANHAGTGQPASDTSWTMQSINVDAFAGQRIFIYFNHNANDGDALYLDEMWVKEGTAATSVEELNAVNFNVYPNPSKGEFTINLSANQANNVSMVVRDVVGKTIVDRTFNVSGQKTETVSLTDYSKGIYFLTIDNKTVKLIVE